VRQILRSLSKHSKKLVGSDVEKSKLRLGVAGQMEDYQGLIEADNPADPEAVNGHDLCRNVVVLEVLGHAGELASFAEAEDGGGLVEVDDALASHAERVCAVLA